MHQHQTFTNDPPGPFLSGQSRVVAPKHNRELRQPTQTSIKAAGSKSNPPKAQKSIDKEHQIPWLPEAASDPAHSGPNGAPVLCAADRATRQTPPTNTATDNLKTNKGQRLPELISPSPKIRPSG